MVELVTGRARTGRDRSRRPPVGVAGAVTWLDRCGDASAGRPGVTCLPTHSPSRAYGSAHEIRLFRSARRERADRGQLRGARVRPGVRVGGRDRRGREPPTNEGVRNAEQHAEGWSAWSVTGRAKRPRWGAEPDMRVGRQPVRGAGPTSPSFPHRPDLTPRASRTVGRGFLPGPWRIAPLRVPG